MLVIEVDLGAVVNRALLSRDFYYNPLLAAHHKVGQEGPGDGAPPHFSQLTEGRASWGPMIGASARSTANSALQFEHLTEDQSTILQSRSAAMPYQLREARNADSESVWPTLNSEWFLLNLFGFAGLVAVRVLLLLSITSALSASCRIPMYLVRPCRRPCRTSWANGRRGQSWPPLGRSCRSSCFL